MNTNQKTLGVLARWMMSANVNKVAPRTVAQMRTINKHTKNLIGNAKSIKSVRNLKERAKKIANRRRYLMNKMNKGPLNKEEREFLQYYNFAKMRGNAYMKSINNKKIRRQPASLFSNDPLSGYLLFPNMKTVHKRGNSRYIITPVHKYSTNVKKHPRRTA